MGSMYSFGDSGLEKVMDENYNITQMDQNKANFIENGNVSLSVDIESTQPQQSYAPSPENGLDL